LGYLARWVVIGYIFGRFAEWSGEDLLQKETADE